MESGETLHATKLPEEMPVPDDKFQKTVLQYDHEKTFRYMSAEMLKTYRARRKEGRGRGRGRVRVTVRGFVCHSLSKKKTF